MRWADATLPEDDAECAIVLRRACDIGMGRGMDLDAVPVADQLPQIDGGRSATPCSRRSCTSRCATSAPSAISAATRIGC